MSQAGILQLRSADRWVPESLGALARFTADSRYLALTSGNVDRWRNLMDGRSGVLVNADAQPPTPGVRGGGQPVIDFTSADRLLDSTNAAISGRSFLIDGMSGTNPAYTVMTTLQMTDTSFGQILFQWGSGSNPILNLRILFSSNVLQITRVSDGGSTEDVQGDIEIGTAIRRLCMTCDGVTTRMYVDSVQESSTIQFSNATTFTAFRLGATDGNIAMRLGDFTVLPRGINRNEWLRYYEWSVKQFGAIRTPTLAGAGAGAAGLGAGTITPAFPTIQAGDFLFGAAVQFNETTPVSFPAGWTLWSEVNIGSLTASIFFKDARAVAESGTINVGVNSTASAVQLFAIRGVNLVSFNAISDFSDQQTGGGDSCPAPTVSANGYGRLGIAIYFGVGTSPGAATGANGGTWAETSEYPAGVSALFIQSQTVNLSNPATVSGGTTSWTGAGGTESIAVGFTLVGV